MRSGKTIAYSGVAPVAAAAAVGLLRVTLFALARPVVDLHPMLLLGPVAVFAAELFGVHPIMLIGAGTPIGRFRRSSFHDVPAHDRRSDKLGDPSENQPESRIDSQRHERRDADHRPARWFAVE